MLDGSVTVNEIMYHPTGSAGEAALEWVELRSAMAVDVDLSGWSIAGGIDFAFPQGTVLRGGAFLVVAANPAALASVNPGGFAGAAGPFAGRLANEGETIRLVNNSGRVMDEVGYADDGDWPVAADGSGASLAKRRHELAGADGDNWSPSAQPGGTPGAENFPAPDLRPFTRTLVAAPSTWKYQATGADPGAAWRTTGFNDSSWASGPALLYGGNATVNPSGGEPPASLAAAPLPLANAGFEDGPANPYPGHGPLQGWTAVGGGVGHNDAGGPFNNGLPIPEGRRVGYVQFAGSIGQTVSGLQPGKRYTLQYFENERGQSGGVRARVSASLGGSAVVAAHDVYRHDAYRRVVGQPFTATGSTAQLVLQNTADFATYGDNAALFDAVTLTRAVPRVANGSFEEYALGPADYEYNPTGPGVGWTFNGPAVSSNGSAFQGESRAAEGNQLLAIQTTGSLSQTVSGFEAGARYSLGWSEQRRTNHGGANDLEIVLDAGLPTQVVISPRHLVEHGSFLPRTSNVFAAAKSSYTLTLRGTNPLGGDNTTFIDDVHFNFVSEQPPLRTQLPVNPPTTHYFRSQFQFTDNASSVQLRLNSIVDDGAVFYLNGQEIYRHNMPAGPVGHATPAATVVGDAGFTGSLVVPPGALVQGTNVLAVEVHQATGAGAGSDLLFGAELEASVTPAPLTGPPALAFNEVAAPGGSFAVELVNHGTSSLNVGGYVIKTSAGAGAEYTLPAGQTLAPGGYLSITQSQLGFAPAAGDKLFLYRPGKVSVLDGVEVATRLRGRAAPAGTGDWLFPSAPTFGGANAFQLNSAVVINEIMYHHRPQRAPYQESGEQWIELFNRGTTTVNLSGWTIADAVDFTFPAGTSLAPGGYLVIAKDAPALRALHPSVASRIIGNFARELSGGSDRVLLVDAAGNPADEVHYYDNFPWPSDYADGGGSSLELRDPNADNSSPESWAASDESARAGWQTYTYRGVAAAEPAPSPTLWNELVLGLLEAGEVLIDDVRVTESPAGVPRQLIQNGGFQADVIGSAPAAWRVIGNHAGVVTADPANATNKVLRLTATGPTEHMHNHAETTFAGNRAIVNGREYEISFRAKWLAGSDQFNSRLYFNRLPRVTTLQTAAVSGTPGVQNSRYRANAGPTFKNLTQSPAVPAPSEPVSVSVTAQDPQAIAGARLWYSAAGGAWASVAMSAGPNGRYTGVVPPQPAGTLVQFYVEATDGAGATTTYPAAGRDSRALYKVSDGQAGPPGLNEFRILQTPADVELLYRPTNVMSNDRLGATVVSTGRDGVPTVFHDVQLRLKSGGYGRAGVGAGWNIRFPADNLFRGVQESVAIDRGSGPFGGLGASQHELLLKHIANTSGGIPEMYDDVIHVIAPRGDFTGDAQLLTSRYEDIFLDSQYENGADGMLYEFELIYYSTVTENGDPQALKLPPGYNAVVPLEVDIADLGNDKESYRWNYLVKNGNGRDDYARLIEFAKAFSLPAGSAALNTATQAVMDVDEWMRVFAMTSLTGLGDTYNVDLNHNLALFVRPEDNRVLAMPWDSDHAFLHGYDSPLFGRRQMNLQKIIALPGNRRLFYGHLLDMMDTTFNRGYLAPWVPHYAGLTGQNFTDTLLTYIDQRSAFVRGQLPAQVPFRITTNNGNNFTTSQSTVTIGGDAWINVKEIRIAGRSGALPLTWSDTDSWSTAVPLVNGANALTFQAYDFRGNLIASDSITVTTSATGPSPINDLRVTEIMYHPADPPVGSPYTADDFEFVEFQNIGAAPLPLDGVRFGAGLEFAFPGGVTLGPGQFTVVVKNRAAFESRYGTAGIAIAGEYGASSLDNGGEPLRLETAAGQPILDFAYGDDDWYPSTDGLGPSLVIRDPRAAASSWGLAASWRPSSSANPGGSPGAADPAPGAAAIAARHVFYNNSAYDTPGDDGAIAAGKSPLLPTAAATAANYTSYSRGINGLMVDIAGLPAGAEQSLTAADFRFRTGNDTNPAGPGWTTPATNPTVSIRRGAGVNRSDRVTLVWPDNAIQKTWLQVTVLANTDTGLTAPDVFYFGNAIGETLDNPALFKVDSQDVVRTRNAQLRPTTIQGLYDHDRDGRVTTQDQAIARNHQGFTLARLTAPAAAPAALTTTTTTAPAPASETKNDTSSAPPTAPPGDATPTSGKSKRRATSLVAEPPR